MGRKVYLNVLEELACGEGILAAGTGMHYQGMHVSAAALQARKSSRGAAVLTIVPLLQKRLIVQNYLAVDLQYQELKANQRVQSRRATAGLPVEHRDFAKHPNRVEEWNGNRMC